MKRRYKLLAVLIPLLMILIFAEMARRRMANLTEQFRQLLLVELRNALNAPVEIGSASGSIFGTVRVQEIVVGKNRKLPGGAIFRARSMVAKPKVWEYLRGEIDPVNVVDLVTVESPVLFVHHYSDGTWNLQRLIRKKKRKRFRFMGRVIAVRGTVHYLDEFLAKKGGVPAVLRANSVEGYAQFAGQLPARFEVNGTFGKRCPRAEVAGWVRLQNGGVVASIHADDADAAFLARYLIPRRDYQVEGGRVDGNVLIAYARLPDPGDRSSFSGTLTLRNARAYARPLGQQPIESISGPVSLTERRIELNGVTARVGSSWFNVKGTLLSVPNPRFDLNIDSNRLAFADLASAKLYPQNLRFSPDTVGSVRVRATGTLNSLTVSGTANISRASVLYDGYGGVSARDLSIQFGVPSLVSSLHMDGLSGTVRSAMLDLSGLALHRNRSPIDNVEITRVTNLKLRIRDFPAQPVISGDAEVPSLRIGQLEARNMYVSARYHDGHLGVTRLNAEVAGGGLSASGQVQFADVPQLAVHARLDGASLDALRPVFGKEVPYLSGHTNLDVTANGTPDVLALKLSGRAITLNWRTDAASDVKSGSARNLALRLGGTLSRSDALPWKFDGGAEARASEVSLEASPSQPTVRSALLQGVSITAMGSVAQKDRRGVLLNADGFINSDRANVVLSHFPNRPSDVPVVISARDIASDFSSDERRLKLSSVRAYAMGGDWLADLELPREDGHFASSVFGDGIDMGEVASLFGVSDLKGNARLLINASGTRDAPIVHADVVGTDVETQVGEFGRGRIRATWEDHRITLHDAWAWSGGARLSLSGQITDVDFEKRDGSLKLSAEIRGGDLRHLASLFDIPVKADGILSADGHIDGTLQHPEATAHTELVRTEMNGIVFDQIVADGIYRDGIISTDRIFASVADAQLLVSGSFNPSHRMIDAVYNIKNVPGPLITQAFGWKSKVAGRFSMQGTIRGRHPDETLTASMGVSELRVEGQQLGDLKADLTAHPSMVDIRSLTLTANNRTRTLKGTFPLRADSTQPFDASLEMEDEPLPTVLAITSMTAEALIQNQIVVGPAKSVIKAIRSVPQPATGRVSATVTISGMSPHPQIKITRLRLLDPTFAIEPLPSIVDGELIWSDNRLLIKSLAAESKNEKIVVAPDSSVSRDQLNITLNMERFVLGHLRPWVRLDNPVDGEMNGMISFRGTMDAPEMESQFRVTDLRTHGVKIDSIQVSHIQIGKDGLQVKEGDLTVERQGAKASIWGTVPIRLASPSVSTTEPLEIHVRANNQTFDVGADLPSHLKSATGNISTDLVISGTFSSPRFGGDLSVGHAAITLKKFPLEISDLNLRLHLDDETKQVRIDQAQGQWRIVSAEKGGTRGSPLGDIPFFRNVARRAAPPPPPGSFQFSGNITLVPDRITDWLAQRFDLTLSFKDGNWLPPAGSGLRDIEGQIALATQTDGMHRFSITSFSAGDIDTPAKKPTGPPKELVIAGTIDIPPRVPRDEEFWRFAQYNIRADMSSFALHQPHVFHARASGVLTLKNDANDGAPLLSGNLIIDNARVVGLIRGGEATKGLPDLPRLNVAFNLGSDVRIRNSNVDVQMDGRGTIRGTPAFLNVRSTFAARRGTLTLPGASLRLVDATTSVQVTGDGSGNLSTVIDMNLRAEGRLEGRRLTLVVQGPLALGDPERPIPFRIETFPPMGQTQLYAKLLGLPVYETVGSEDQLQRSVGQRIVSVVQTPIIAGISEEFRRAFGLDILDVGYQGRSTSVRFGKELTRNLFLTFRKEVAGSTQLNTIRMDYRIKGRFLLGVQVDERERIFSLDYSLRF